MLTLQVELGVRGYPIYVGEGLLDRLGQEIGDRSACIITDDNVAPYYLDKALNSFHGQLKEAAFVVPAGEGSKTMASVEKALDWLLERRFPRDGVLVALGGGVVGDLAGFVAAIYHRGVDFVQVPTTLLAQVDSSVGGKTGVNHPKGKNLIGAFHQPRVVLADTSTLSTLESRHLKAGLAEVIKYGMLADSTFFAWLERNLDRLSALDPEPLARAIERCCALKARIVVLDEREAGPRALLNLGHTFGHAIETWTGYSKWLHGEAVAVGLCMAAYMSARMGWIQEEAAQRCLSLVERAGLPTTPPSGMHPGDFIELMKRDKKVTDHRLHLVLMRRIGEAVLSADFDPAALDATLGKFCGALT